MNLIASWVMKEHLCKNRQTKEISTKLITLEQWMSYELVTAEPHITQDETGTYALEMRNCPDCDSTLGVETKVG